MKNQVAHICFYLQLVYVYKHASITKCKIFICYAAALFKTFMRMVTQPVHPLYIQVHKLHTDE